MTQLGGWRPLGAIELLPVNDRRPSPRVQAQIQKGRPLMSDHKDRDQQNEQVQQEGDQSGRQDLLFIHEPPNKKPQITRIGSVYPHKDGLGANLDDRGVLQLGGRLMIRDPAQRLSDQRGKSEKSTEAPQRTDRDGGQER